MKPEFEYLEVIKNEKESRFEMKVDGHLAFIDYKENPGVILLTHTESPLELEGRGVAKVLVEKTLRYLEENNYVLEPLCPYVFTYIKKNPEWKRILSDEFQEKINTDS
ncbi:GNAT family N-acetyltransferase [Moheibacter stercoris]|uniref:GNAT family acetyltransferase n=1 Tax=Moheibacter stercoris TaxID=1628251 RepID=A0ABV2LRX2_9FLAO